MHGVVVERLWTFTIYILRQILTYDNVNLSWLIWVRNITTPCNDPNESEQNEIQFFNFQDLSKLTSGYTQTIPSEVPEIVWPFWFR